MILTSPRIIIAKPMILLPIKIIAIVEIEIVTRIPLKTNLIVP